MSSDMGSARRCCVVCSTALAVACAPSGGERLEAPPEDAAVLGPGPDAAGPPDHGSAERDAAVTPWDAGASAMAGDAARFDALAPDAGDETAGASDAGPLDLVSPLGNGARFVSDTLPGSMITGEVRGVTFVLANVGTTTWSSAEAYLLGSPDDGDPFADARAPLDLGAIPPGGYAEVEVRLIAPSSPGVYRSDWRMLREHVEWFGETRARDIEVVLGPCSNPVPPPLDMLRAVIHLGRGYHKVLDSTPLVLGLDYCAEIGFTDGRSRCPPRPEGHPEVEVCNTFTVGVAADTGRTGPTWTFNGLPCVAAEADGRCVNHESNQFLVNVYGSGLARACAASGVCGEVEVP